MDNNLPFVWEVEPLYSTFEGNSVPIILMSSNAYAPLLGVFLQSVIDHASEENNYDIIVLEKEISKRNKKLISTIVEGQKNFTLRFINPEKIGVSDFSLHISRPEYAREAYYRLFVPWILLKYKKVICMDCDIIVKRDLAELYSVSMGDKLIAAVGDAVWHAFVNADGALNQVTYKYATEIMGLSDPLNYVNTGVMLMDLDAIRKEYSFDYVVDYAQSHHFSTQEQDLINALFESRIKHLDFRWNVYLMLLVTDEFDQYIMKDEKLLFEKAAIEPWIIHFNSASSKPWNNPTVEYGAEFWAVAKKTPFYEYFLFYMRTDAVNKLDEEVRQLKNKLTVLSSKHKDNRENRFLKQAWDCLFPRYTLRRETARQLYFMIMGKPTNNLNFFWRMKLSPIYLATISHFPGSSAFRLRRQLKSYKDKHKGQRCFFVGNGPSLRKEDVENLSGEITFAVNNVFPMFEQTNWRPTYYFFQEFIAPGREDMSTEFYSKILDSDLPTVFLPYCRMSKNLKRERQGATVIVPISVDFCMYWNQPINKFSQDCTRVVNAAYLSAYSVFQLIAYMGFSEIYLLGCDASYSRAKPHFYEKDNIDKIIHKSKESSAKQTEGINFGFDAIKRAIDNIPGITVYNATRGGKLELFIRKDLEEVLRIKEK